MVHFVRLQVPRGSEDSCSDECSEIVAVHSGKTIHIWTKGRGRHITGEDSCQICRIIEGSGLIVVGGESCGDHVTYELLVPHIGSLKRALRDLHSSGYRPRVVSNAVYVPSPPLTMEQIKVLRLAYVRGYFDEKRAVTVKEIAELLGTSPASVDRMLRRALRNLVGYYLPYKSGAGRT